MKSASAPSYSVRIWMAGDIAQAKQVCQDFCDGVSYCVSLTATVYIFKGGYEAGFIVGLIHYPRFPSSPAVILAKAEALALRLMHALDQGSYTIETPEESTWYSRRADA